MKKRKALLEKITEQLKIGGASTGEILTEENRLQSTSLEGLTYYLDGIVEENKRKGLI